MSVDLTIVETHKSLPAALGADLVSAVDLAKAEKAPSTRKAYETDFRLFQAWCDARGVNSLPAASETVAAYIAAEAGRSRPSTLGRRLAALRYAHKLAGLPLPADSEGVKATMRGIRRTYGSTKVRKAPAVAAKMLGMVATAPVSLGGQRDRALLLLGFAGAFRRSEIVALDVADIEETEAGLLVTIRHSKTDQEGEGVTIAIARGDVACPVKALRAWLGSAGIEDGPLFRPINKAGRVAAARLTDRSVANIVKVYAERAGFDASTFSGHSLRSGFLTSAAANGASIFKMMDVSRHKSVETLRGYVRDAELFKDHAGSGLL
ncbi:site-specific integrase [Bradyrhizobium sp. JYMT SZCCT0428]|uniref:site-specific integrase n=1 Tax=Bradyrhizobium sp. JYMT SZCCT0428 TaxID=2807673 RepID=UPI001BAE338D|nr:site-specific integrase [Bradyrhizobium sp. JYMT SZCCT0428]MBR1155245.1 site-specific integrase [Bradyrhizobium sp. JYMT SZCCT0428]